MAIIGEMNTKFCMHESKDKGYIWAWKWQRCHLLFVDIAECLSCDSIIRKTAISYFKDYQLIIFGIGPSPQVHFFASEHITPLEWSNSEQLFCILEFVLFKITMALSIFFRLIK